MKLLLINPNISEDVTAIMAAEARSLAAGRRGGGGDPKWQVDRGPRARGGRSDPVPALDGVSCGVRLAEALGGRLDRGRLDQWAVRGVQYLNRGSSYLTASPMGDGEDAFLVISAKAFSRAGIRPGLAAVGRAARVR